jgi:hypothetical protein
MLGAGMLPSGKPVITGNITAPPKGPTFAFGEYILSYQGCRECHGRHLAGRGSAAHRRQFRAPNFPVLIGRRSVMPITS